SPQVASCIWDCAGSEFPRLASRYASLVPALPTKQRYGKTLPTSQNDWVLLHLHEPCLPFTSSMPISSRSLPVPLPGKRDKLGPSLPWEETLWGWMSLTIPK